MNLSQFRLNLRTTTHFLLPLSAFVLAASTAACGPFHLPVSPSIAERNVSSFGSNPASPRDFRVLLAFSGRDGSHPWYDDLAAIDGTLYGTTASGGAYGRGSVFSLTQDGQQKVLYSFKFGADGFEPIAGPTAVNGTLYGTTQNGGMKHGGYGTVYSISTLGKERVLYAFQGGADGTHPMDTLTAFKDKLYGTTSGGSYPGTVFSVTMSGKETVLHRFGGSGDGSYPFASLTLLNGRFYGSTSAGGKYNRGTIFSITPEGGERVLYSFQGGRDGWLPNGLTVLKGALYGTTYQGGGTGCRGDGCGTIFKIDRSGNERVLYRFNNYNDGAFPAATLTALGGTLYGTSSEAGYKVNFGTVFSISREGREHLIYSFRGGKNGAFPQSRLTVIKGVLFGTTTYGGGSRCYSGCGTVFALKP